MKTSIKKVAAKITHVVNDAHHKLTEFALKHPPTLKPKNKRAK